MMGVLPDCRRGCLVGVLIDGFGIAVMDVWFCVGVGGVLAG